MSFNNDPHLELSSSFAFVPTDLHNPASSNVPLQFPPLEAPSTSSGYPDSVQYPIEAALSSLPTSVDIPIAPAPPFILPPLPSEDSPDATEAYVDPLKGLEQDAEVVQYADEGDGAVRMPRLQQLAVFAIPTLAIWLSSPLLSVIDTAVVGKVCSTAQLAALGPSTKMCDNIAYFASAIGAATTNLAADAFASGHPNKAHRIVGGSLTIALGLGFAIAVGLRMAATPLMTTMVGASSAAAIAPAAQYTAIRALGYPAALTTMVLQAAFLASKDATSPLLALPLVAGANLLGDLILVGPMKMGAAGAAFATIAAQFVNAAVLLVLWKRKVVKGRITAAAVSAAYDPAADPDTVTDKVDRRVRVMTVPSPQEAVTLAAFIAPMMLAIGARSYMGIAMAAAVASLGTVSLAAHQVVECLYWLFSPFGDAVSLSVQAFLPTLLKRSAVVSKRLQGLALRGAAALSVFAGASGAALLVGAPGLFTTSATVSAVLGQVAPLLGVSLVGYVITGALEGALLARRQLRLLAASHVFNTAVLAFGVRRVLAGGGGLRQLWSAMAMLNFARIAEFAWALRRAERQSDEAAAAEAEAIEAKRRTDEQQQHLVFAP